MGNLLGRLMYFIGYIIFKFYFKLIHKWKVLGKTHRPSEGPLIIMSNHISFFDPPIISCIMNRPVYFMAKEELFNNLIFGWILRKIGVFSVKRGRPDRKAIKKAFKILEEDKILGLFPEGTRHKEGNLGKARAGAVMIALRSEAPILPVGIKNIKNDSRLKVSIGKPFKLEEYYGKKLSRAERKKVGSYIMNKINSQLDNL